MSNLDRKINDQLKEIFLNQALNVDTLQAETNHFVETFSHCNTISLEFHKSIRQQIV